MSLPSYTDYVLQDKIYRGLRPSVKQDGRYFFFRDAFATEVRMVEPSGDSYLLPYFVFQTVLKTVLQLSEEKRESISGLLWNFRRVFFETKGGRVAPYTSRRNYILHPDPGPRTSWRDDIGFPIGT